MAFHVRFFIILFFLIQSKGIAAQESFINRLNIKKGMASNEVYSVLQDHIGKMWFTTSNGISVFNGFSVKNYTTKDGLLDNVVFKQCQDSKKRIWFGALNRKLFYYENQQFKPALSSNGDTLTIPMKELLDFFAVGDTIYASTSYRTYRISPQGKHFLLTDLAPENPTANLVFQKIHGRFCIVYRSFFPLDKLTPTLLNLQINDDSTTIRQQLKFGTYIGTMFCFVTKRNNHDYYVSVSNQLFHIRKNVLVNSAELPNEIIYFRLKNPLTLDVYTRHRGIIIMNLEDIRQHLDTLYPDYTITDWFIDHEGGKWLTTLESGVLYDASESKSALYIKYLHNTQVNKILNTDSQLWFGNKKGVLTTFQPNASNHQPFVSYDLKSGEFRDMEISSSILVTSLNWNTFVFKQYQGQLKLLQKMALSYKAISNIINETFYGSQSPFIRKYHQATEIQEIIFKPYVYTLYQDSAHLYIGTNQGLFILQEGKILPFPIHQLPSNERVQELTSLDGNLYIGTKNSGLYIYNFLTKKTIKISQENSELINNCISAIIPTTNKKVYIGTPKGISIISFPKDTFSIENYTSSDGMLSDQITSLAVFDNYLFCGTYDGIFAWPLDKIAPNKVPPITTIDFAENLSGVPFSGSFHHTQNDIRIGFSSSAFRNLESIRCRYRLKKTDAKYYEFTSKDGLLNLLRLEPGVYDIEIFTANNSGIWSQSPATLHFTIFPPFWKEPLFILSSFIGLFIILYFLFRRRFQILKKQEKEKAQLIYQMEVLKMQALRLQINPHFLFNALNNIQGYYAGGNTQLAKDYIYHLSRLLRLVLETSKDEIIDFEQELEILEYYFELNKFRYEGVFAVKMEIPPELNSEGLVLPPLITQPFIENAFVHVFSKMNSGGILQFEAIYHEKILVIKISDNGQTITEQQIQALYNSPPTRGIGITQERIRVFNAKNGYFGKPTEFIINPMGGLTVQLFLKQPN